MGWRGGEEGWQDVGLDVAYDERSFDSAVAGQHGDVVDALAACCLADLLSMGDDVGGVLSASAVWE